MNPFFKEGEKAHSAFTPLQQQQQGKPPAANEFEKMGERDQAANEFEKMGERDQAYIYTRFAQLQ